MFDAEEVARRGAIPFLLARETSEGRDIAEREGFFRNGTVGFISFGSAALVAIAVLDLVAAGAVIVMLVFEVFVGEPMPKFHTLRTIDLAEDRIPKRGVALPLSARGRSR